MDGGIKVQYPIKFKIGEEVVFKVDDNNFYCKICATKYKPTKYYLLSPKIIQYANIVVNDIDSVLLFKLNMENCNTITEILFNEKSCGIWTEVDSLTKLYKEIKYLEYYNEY